MYKHVTCYVLLILEVVYFYSYEVEGSLQNDITIELGKLNATNLSRTRRYLTFPEGSSFQLVFDLAYPSIDGIGLFVFGNTAAMAWELPSTPIFLDKKFHKKEQPEPTTTMLPHLEHPVDYEHGWQPPASWDDTHKTDYQDYPEWHRKASLIPNYRLSYKEKLGQLDRSPISSYANPFDSYGQKGFNPSSKRYPVHYTKPVTNRGNSYGSKINYYSNRRNLQNKRNQIDIQRTSALRSYGSSSRYEKDLHHNIHRITRRELYSKLEELLSALIKNGKSCILKIICQVNKTPKGKGTLWEELLKTVFKVKPDDFYEDEDQYDEAANSAHNCDEIYSECEGNIISKVIKTALKK